MERRYARFNFTDAFLERHVMKDLQGWIHSSKPMPVHLIVDQRRGDLGAHHVLIPKYNHTDNSTSAQMLDSPVTYMSPDYSIELHQRGGYLWVQEHRLEYIYNLDSNSQARHLLHANPNKLNDKP